MKCPHCSIKTYLYKEIYDDETCKIICLKCGWKTGKLDRHDFIDVPTKKELKQSWD